MMLPIDYGRRPFKEKYLDETEILANWFEFGEHPDGTVDISTANGDVIVKVPQHEARLILEARRAFLAEIHAVLGYREGEWEAQSAAQYPPITKYIDAQPDPDALWWMEPDAFQG